MDEFNAKNHLLDLRREAANERLVQLVKAGVEAKQQKAAPRSLLINAFKLLTWIFAQSRRMSDQYRRMPIRSKDS